ncbi:ABC transporter ATP-binding protein [Halalkalibacterium halodurans]|uniref:ABC transporter ATP-binding protein n=1 Tax=Halalkalibacterium halodurans TaxID=86665 RepID=UPI002AAA349D|nr:ABC transporter ATP-binding protein [Halalkalibacterium halodurans]MDY7223231.1 ABC transporter ATP-binding protein [Halalkalibacterium halodurans]MDY7242452.1 ABC transporter ATP-binding protein [Halalkalibacterium halodurans]
MIILEANHLHKVYGEGGTRTTVGLDQVSLRVKKGDFLAIMGPSGSGKTTLLNLLSGIDAPTSGTIVINGDDISKMDGNQLALFRRKELGFVFQEFNLLDSLTVKENIMVPMILEKKSAKHMEEKAKEVMSIFGIDGLANKYPYHLSGGQQQRVAVSRALVNEPSILFADEPTGNLDSKSSKVIMECFEQIVNHYQTTILLVTHDVLAANYCHHVMFINDGTIHSKLTKKGSNAEFLDQIMDSLALIGGTTP